jgi:membrane protease YdiL (CAAX protease family)
MTGSELWTRVAITTALAWGSAVLIRPPTPSSSVSWPWALVGGCAVGTGLFVLVTRQLSVGAHVSGAAHLFAAKNVILGLWAANEELLWRRLLLGEGLRVGASFALAVSTVGFAFAHRARRQTHLFTGAAFGATYLALGSLVAPIAAHWTYNALLAASVHRARAPTIEGAA